MNGAEGRVHVLSVPIVEMRYLCLFSCIFRLLMLKFQILIQSKIHEYFNCIENVDAEINHQRHSIKIPFINKGMDFIDLPSIFQDRSVTSSIPDYFQNSEPPIICYKYNKPIRHTIFNFNKLVSDLDIHANTPSS